MLSLKEEFKRHHDLSAEGEAFLMNLEKNISQDLWQSAGGHWSSESMERFRSIAIEKLVKHLRGFTFVDFQEAWVEVVRDFHDNQAWGEIRLTKKRKSQKQKKIEFSGNCSLIFGSYCRPRS